MSVRKAIRVQVTKTGIAKGHPSETAHCPIARAFRKANPKARWVEVDIDGIMWGLGDGNDFYAPIPRSARRFIAKFDNGEKVKPFSFRLLLRDVQQY